MKITIEETGGGVTGMKFRPKIVDTDDSTMSNDDIQHLNTLIQKSNFFALPPSFLPTAKHSDARDYKTYKITIDSNKGHHSVMYSDISKKDNTAFSELIGFIEKHAHDDSK